MVSTQTPFASLSFASLSFGLPVMVARLSRYALQFWPSRENTMKNADLRLTGAGFMPLTGVGFSCPCRSIVFVGEAKGNISDLYQLKLGMVSANQ
jgi:hypothetical protein